MLTTIDKALAPLLSLAVVYLNQKYGWKFDASPETLLLVLGAINTLLVYFVPNKPGTVVVNPKVAAIMIGALLLVGSVHDTQAQPRTPALPSSADILNKLLTDASAAKADADQNNDTIAATCYAAIAAVAGAKLNAAQVTGGGALTAFQKVRDVTRLNASPVGTQLIVGCAPLVQDAKINLVQFFTNAGAAILLKGFIPLP